MASKINLSQDDQVYLQNLASSGAKGYEVAKKIFNFYMNDLVNVLNIDAKGNVGLQTCARQEAYKILVEVSDLLFPGETVGPRSQSLPGTTGEKKSQWR